jgi:hypothetical protein
LTKTSPHAGNAANAKTETRRRADLFISVDSISRASDRID